MTGNVLSGITGYMLGRTPKPETRNNFRFRVICATSSFFVGLRERVQAL